MNTSTTTLSVERVVGKPCSPSHESTFTRNFCSGTVMRKILCSRGSLSSSAMFSRLRRCSVKYEPAACPPSECDRIVGLPSMPPAEKQKLAL